MGEKTTTTGEVTFSATFAESKTTPTTKETDNSQKESVQVNQGAGQACQITFDVLSSQNTLDYDVCRFSFIYAGNPGRFPDNIDGFIRSLSFLLEPSEAPTPNATQMVTVSSHYCSTTLYP